jgi:orotidine-5'-phosphate decarboxylase
MAEPTTPFGQRLSEAIIATSPLCVGIDPSKALLEAWGLDDAPSGLERLGRCVIEAVAGRVPAIKPQIAYFERHGAQGYEALERVLADARAARLLVVADVKRGDIDSTMEAYGEAWLGDESPLVADAMTVTTYLGFQAMAAVVDRAQASGRGLFVVVASSNPEGRALQTATLASGQRVEAGLLEELGRINSTEVARSGAALGSIGAVVGATRTAGELELSSLGGPFLVPGLGAQGANASDVGRLFRRCRSSSVLVNASRSILGAGPSKEKLARAAGELGAELREALG